MKSLRNILFYTENYERGGGNQYFIDLLNSIPRECVVDVLSNSGGLYREDFEKLKYTLDYREIDILSISNWYRIAKDKKWFNLLRIFAHSTKYILLIIFHHINSRRLKKFLSFNQYDLIISCNGGYPGGLTCLDLIGVSSSLGIETWLTVVSMPQKKTLINRFYDPFLQKVNKIIVNSKLISKEFTEFKGISKTRIEILYNCMPNARIEKVPLQQITYSSNLEEYVLGYVGRIEKSKGIFYLLEAFTYLSLEFSNLKLVLVGSGRDLDLARKFCLDRGIENNVEFTGFFSGAIEEVLKNFDLFVFPSLWEGLPYSVLEAMACSRLVVSTNVGGIPEIIEDGVTGFLVPPSNFMEICRKIKYILQDLKNRDEIVERALKNIQSNFSEDNFCLKFRSFFEDARTLNAVE